MSTLNLELPTFRELRRERAETEAAEKRRENKKRLRRSYDAARRNRLNHDWTVVNTSANFELRRSLAVLRARSRNVARNNDLIKKFLSMVRNNVSGPHGMKYQARAVDSRGELDAQLNQKIERAWREWCHKEFASLSGKLSFRDIERKVDTHLARDGEALVRAVAADNKFGFSLRVYAVDWLDETYNERLTSGNRVIMSVEVDANDRPVAYWLTPPPADYQFLDTNQPSRYRTRVPAEEIVHCYLPDDENSDDDSQTRGVPWTHTAMQRMKDLAGYVDAEITAARVAASKMGFFKKTTPDEDSFDGDDTDEEDGIELMDSAQPGTFGIIPEDYEFQEWNPEHPNSNAGAFLKTMIRLVAVGLDVTYFTLAEDLEGVNYSSTRTGLLAERDTWRALQQFKIEHFNRPIFLLWLRAALVSGVLDIRVSDYKRLIEPVFQPRGWRWTQPDKEADATVTGINNGFDTITDTLAEQGIEIEEYVTKRKRELKLLKDAGIETTPMSSGGNKQPSGQGSDGEGAPLKK